MFNEILQKINIREIIFLSFFVRIASLILYPSKVLPDTYTYLKIGEEIFSGKNRQAPKCPHRVREVVAPQYEWC